MSSTLAAGTNAFTSAGEMSVTRAPTFCAWRALCRRCGALSGPASASMPTCWKPGSPSPPTTSFQWRNISAAALAVRVKKSIA